MSTFLTPKVNNKDKVIPTKLSELINDVGFIRDTNYKHTDNNFTDSYKSILDNPESSASILSKAKIATDRANLAAYKAEQVKSNFPKIINDNWYIYDDITDSYKDTGVLAKGESFKIKKTYPSVNDMNNDFNNLLVGDFVLIDSNTNDPDNSKLYVKTESDWKFLSDLSGSIGITGFSAYEIAVNNGYEGTEQEWIESLSLDSKNAAKVTLQSVDRVNLALNNLSSLKEEVQETNNTLLQTDSEIKENETVRQNNESNRIAAEIERNNAETNRNTLYGELLEIKTDLGETKENLVNSIEDSILNASNTVSTLESSVNSTINEANSNIEETINSAEESMNTIISNSNDAINRTNTAISNVDQKLTEVDQSINQKIAEANQAISRTNQAGDDAISKLDEINTATSNANLATTNANTQADRAKNYSDNPPTIISGFWYLYDENLKSYVNTNVRAEGLKGDTGAGVTIKGSLNSISELPISASEGDSYLINGYLYVYVKDGGNVSENPAWDNVGKIQGPPGTDATVTKEAVESVLVGNINTHNHNNIYYTKSEIDDKDAPVDSKQYVKYNGNWTAIDLSSVDPYEAGWILNLETITDELLNELIQAIEDKKRIILNGINPTIISVEESEIIINLINNGFYEIVINKSSKTITKKINNFVYTPDFYNSITKSIDHVPTKSDINYEYEGTSYEYSVGTLVTYNNKIYQLYNITNGEADWKEVINKEDLDNTTTILNENIAIKEATRELKTALETVINLEENSLVDDNTYNILRNNLTLGKIIGINNNIIKVEELSDDIINLSFLPFKGYSSSSISIIQKKINKINSSNTILPTENGISIQSNSQNVEKNITLLNAGDGTKFLNDKGEYITVGILPLPEEYFSIIDYLININESGIIEDDNYNKILELCSKGKAWYEVSDSILKNVFFYENNSNIEIQIWSEDVIGISKMYISITKATKEYSKLVDAFKTECSNSNIIIGNPIKGPIITFKTGNQGNAYLNDKGEYTVPLLITTELYNAINNIGNLEINSEVPESIISILDKYINSIYFANSPDYIEWFTVNISKTESNYSIVITLITGESISNRRSHFLISYTNSKYIFAGVVDEELNISAPNNNKINLKFSSSGKKADITLDASGDGTKVLADNGQYVPMTGGSVTVDETLSDTSTNPIQNKAVANKFKHQYISAVNRVYGYTTEGNIISIDDATPDNCVALVYHDVYTDKVYMIEKIQDSSSVYYWGGNGVDSDIANEQSWNGKTNSDVLKTILTCDDSHVEYSTIGVALNTFIADSNKNLGFTDWYIPSTYEACLIGLYYDNINAALEKIGGVALPEVIWASDEVDSTQAYSVRLINYSNNSSTKTSAYPVIFIRELSKDILPVPTTLNTAYNYVIFERDIDLKEYGYLNLLSNHIAIAEDSGTICNYGVWSSYALSEQEINILMDDIEITSINMPKLIPTGSMLFNYAGHRFNIFLDNSNSNTDVFIKFFIEIFPYLEYNSTLHYTLGDINSIEEHLQISTLESNEGDLVIQHAITQEGITSSSEILLETKNRGDLALTNSGKYAKFVPGEYAGLYEDGVYAIDNNNNFVKYDSSVESYKGAVIIIKDKAYQISNNYKTATIWNSESIDIPDLVNYTTCDGKNISISYDDLNNRFDKWPKSGVLSNFDGKTNTESILNALDTSVENSFAKAISDFRTENGSGWFVPSGGQLAYISKNKSNILSILKKSSSEISITMWNNGIISSDEYDQNSFWYSSTNNINIVSKTGSSNKYIIFLKEIDFPKPLLLEEVGCYNTTESLDTALQNVLGNDETSKTEAIEYLINTIPENSRKIYLSRGIYEKMSSIANYIIITRDTRYIYLQYKDIYNLVYSTQFPIYYVTICIDSTNKTEVNFTTMLKNGEDYLECSTVENTTGSDVTNSKKLPTVDSLQKYFFTKINNVTDITSLPIDKYGIKATLSTSQTLGFASTPTEGMEFMIDIKNTSSSSITISFPDTMQYDVSSIVIASGKIYSISVRYVFGTYCVRC